MTPLLHAWETFYVIVGSSAAALTGLQFVVVALLAETNIGKKDSVSAFGTPTVVHFCGVLLLAAVCSTPRHSAATLSVSFTLIGLAALAFMVRVIGRARRQTGYTPVFEDWLWHAILPLLAYGSLLVAGICTYAHPAASLYPIAGAALLLLYIGIHNAWDTAVYISARRGDQQNAEETPPPG